MRKITYLLVKQNYIPVIRDNSLITQWYIHVVRGNKLGKSGDHLDNGDCLVIQVSYYPSYLWVFTWDLFTCDHNRDTSSQGKYPTVRQRFFNICGRKPTMRCFQAIGPNHSLSGSCIHYPRQSRATLCVTCNN